MSPITVAVFPVANPSLIPTEISDDLGGCIRLTGVMEAEDDVALVVTVHTSRKVTYWWQEAAWQEVERQGQE